MSQIINAPKTVSLQSQPVYLSPGVWMVGVLFVVYRMFTSINPLEELYAYLTAAIILRLLWRQGYPSVFLFIALIHWLQIFMFIVWNNFYGWSVNTYYYTGGEAYWWSMTGVLCMTIVLHRVLQKTPWANILQAVREAPHFSSSRIFWTYMLLTLINGTLFRWAVTLPTVGQILFWIIDLREMVLLLYAWIVVVRKQPKWGLMLLCAIHFSLSLFNYFGGYKSIFIVLGLLLLMFIRYVNLFRLLILLVGGSVVLFLSIVWISVRGTYREFLSQGTQQQVIKVSRQEAMQQLYMLVTQLTPHQLYKGFENFIYRVQYLQFFSMAMEQVPEKIPYQQGKLTLSNLEFVLMPRILDPHKPILDPSSKTNLYTGAQVATVQQGTSISMGYFVDFYIDFGPVGILFSLIILWMLIGWVYRYFVMHLSSSLAVNIMVLTIFLKRFYLFETDAIGVLGSLYTMTVTLFLLKWLLLPVVLRFWKRQVQYSLIQVAV
ncbi:hypothetical protein [Thermoflavifilum thermophilum]|uniref:Oligosaccharide repeat unit polymerase n=1 Tax=Thermoflavifilum thermophilum TaxID=1393122 RepID=A0A1I7N9L3_9BACT|nr:hypothetical protein [Thermoflavifilum thermophilum]SFV31360.1 hypothetical protein SAMN05660895_1050 [Thermoflavifilum thermophilum]